MRVVVRVRFMVLALLVVVSTGLVVAAAGFGCDVHHRIRVVPEFDRGVDQRELGESA